MGPTVRHYYITYSFYGHKVIKYRTFFSLTRYIEFIITLQSIKSYKTM